MDGFEARALLFLFPRSNVSRQKARGCRATAAVTRQHEIFLCLAETLRPRLKRHDRAKAIIERALFAKSKRARAICWEIAMSQQTTAQASGRWELGPLPTLDLFRRRT